MRNLTFLLLVVLLLSLAACGAESTPTAGGGDAAAGEEVFNQVAAPACGTCHSLNSGETLVGPSLATIGANAGSRVDGVAAEDYLRRSITEPNTDVAEGFAANIMPSTYTGQLTEQQIEDLVAYMLTLK